MGATLALMTTSQFTRGQAVIVTLHGPYSNVAPEVYESEVQYDYGHDTVGVLSPTRYPLRVSRTCVQAV